MQSLRLQMLLFLFLLHLSLVLLHQLLLLLLQLLEHYLLLALLVCEPLGRLLLLTILLQGYLLLLLLRRHGSDTHLLSSRIRLLLLRHDNFDGYFAFIRFIARTLEFGLQATICHILTQTLHSWCNDWRLLLLFYLCGNLLTWLCWQIGPLLDPIRDTLTNLAAINVTSLRVLTQNKLTGVIGRLMGCLQLILFTQMQIELMINDSILSISKMIKN